MNPLATAQDISSEEEKSGLGCLISKAVLYPSQEKPEKQREYCALPQNVVLFFPGTNTKNSGTSQLSPHSSVFYLKMHISAKIGRVA